MNPRFSFSLFMLMCLLHCAPASASMLADVFAALKSDDSAQINSTLMKIESSSLKEKDAYQGALLMKKAGLVSNGLEKLSVFKKGRKLLEAMIKNDSLNAEYRFLRLMIQEHIPDFLNYHKNKNEDAQLIASQFKKMNPELKAIVKEYSTHSEILKPENLQHG